MGYGTKSVPLAEYDGMFSSIIAINYCFLLLSARMRLKCRKVTLYLTHCPAIFLQEFFLIKNWRACLDLLQTYDVVGELRNSPFNNYFSTMCNHKTVEHDQ